MRVKDEDYNEFYKNKFMDYSDPLRVITSRTEGTATYTALLFIPSRTPMITTPRNTKRAWPSMHPVS